MSTSRAIRLADRSRSLPTAKLTINSTITLSTGYKIPLLGFGVYQNKNATPSVIEAFKAGYRYALVMLALCSTLIFEFNPRHVDSAQVYKNEAQVADAVRESGLDRAEVFISMLPYSH